MYLVEKFIDKKRASYSKVNEVGLVDLLRNICSNEEQCVYYKHTLLNSSNVCTIKINESETYIFSTIEKVSKLQKNQRDNLTIEIEQLEKQLVEKRIKLQNVIERLTFYNSI